MGIYRIGGVTEIRSAFTHNGEAGAEAGGQRGEFSSAVRAHSPLAAFVVVVYASARPDYNTGIQKYLEFQKIGDGTKLRVCLSVKHFCL